MDQIAPVSAHHPRPLPPEDSIDCVWLTCFRNDFSILALILQYSAIRMHRAETLEEADFLLTVSGSTVLLSDVAFLDGSWRDALLIARERYPFVTSLIIADPCDWPSLKDAYDCGACGALPKPVDSGQAIRLIRTLHEAARERMSVLGEYSDALVPGRSSPSSR